jgi:hypothetical protein
MFSEPSLLETEFGNPGIVAVPDTDRFVNAPVFGVTLPIGGGADRFVLKMEFVVIFFDKPPWRI